MEYLVDNKKTITITNSDNGDIVVCKNLEGLKDFLLDSILLNPIVLVSNINTLYSNKSEKKKIYEYSTTKTRIVFTDNVKNTYPELFIKLNSKRMYDMFFKARSEIKNGSSILVEVSPYNERKNICKISKEENVFKYLLYKDENGNLDKDETLYLKKLVEVYLNTNGIMEKYRSMADLGKIMSDNSNTFEGYGEPIETIICRKVLKYGKN